jgi:2-polyprenyl-3-methyl-5-hydroxy-6-metoxy-1,4-benzoquinol methylase
MVNFIHSKFHRPEKGWDPIPEDYARKYAEYEWGQIDIKLLNELEDRIGGFQGKRILDLGGGPGQFSISFARQGAHVLWHDISNNYLNIVRDRAKEEGVRIDFSLGYLEDARRILPRQFDLVFNRICWNYCMNDNAFANLIYSLTAPGGLAYIDCNITIGNNIKSYQKVIHFLDNRLHWKIGHPYPPRGRVARLVQRFPLEYVIADYRMGTNDRIFFVKRK